MELFSDIKVDLIDKGDLLALADVTVGKAIRLRGIRVVQGTAGPFISFPAKKMPDGKRFEDVFYAIDKDARKSLKELILSAREKAMAEKAGIEDTF